ncbi:phosphoprotein phosphatase CDC14 [Sugiyamaella lignohabitans]|uniref:Tyrosine-protein phosphatase CDC14 n=1 Tax=Sugiyamaella lignohabitans TaxID=796027 RepID=A0A167FCE8_9ASCO|nr:phosphoprotein phosphatase CDC14 [Sugiyamaella lignohabitans]ANB15114.1 phosphoprotein phosphatase CDC14 [Sugiyamaella lignohabitans]
MVLIQSWPPHLVLAPIAQADPPFMPFRDAGYAVADFTMTIQDVVYGVWRAKEQKLLDLKAFNLEEYELYERVDQGDFNEIPPHFIAFASPQQADYESPLPYSFSQVLDYFEAHQVKLVVRLNSHLYNKEEFEARGIKHIDLIFDDGTCPTMLFVQAFIGAVEGVIAQNGKVAVHCKAGLGRTGCLIGAHLIYTYGFTAAEAIAYMRFLRPGMVVGPQQHWLYLHQNEFREWRRTMCVSKNSDPSLAGYSPLVDVEKELGQHGARSRRVLGTGQPPKTPERSILGEVDNTNSALPVPTPGQPRKNSPSPAHRQASNQLSVLRGNAKPPIDDNDNENYNGRTKIARPINGGANSDDEDFDDLVLANESQPQLLVQKSPKRTVTDTLSQQQQIIMARKLRSTSNPSPQRVRQPRPPSYQYKTTTTTTTTTTTLSSSPPQSPVGVSAIDGPPSVTRRSTRLASGSGGVRKVSAGTVRRK